MFTSFEGDVFLDGEAYAGQALHRTLRDPHTLPDAEARRSREIGRRVRSHEEAWAMHANAANGFGAGETVA